MKTLSLSLAVALAAGIAAVSAVPAAATGKISCKAGPQSGWKSMEDGCGIRSCRISPTHPARATDAATMPPAPLGSRWRRPDARR